MARSPMLVKNGEATVLKIGLSTHLSGYDLVSVSFLYVGIVLLLSNM